MNKEDYFKYYIQGSDHYLIPKDIFNELFNEMNNWKEDTQKYKEVIDKLKELIIELSDNTDDIICYEIDKYCKNDLLDILKEV